MADDPRRFDDLVRTIADMRRQLDGLQSTTLNRLATHVHSGGGGGVTDHGALTGLADDDHTQYHNDTRGDVRYYTKTAADALLAAKQASDSDLTTIAGLTATTDNFLQAKSSAWASRTPTQVAADLVTPLSTSLQPLDSDLTAIAALAPTNDDIVQRKSGAWTNRTMAQLKTDLALNNVTNNAQLPLAGGTMTGAVVANRTNFFDLHQSHKATADTTNRWECYADGYMKWGAGGVAATDTFLYRDAAATLATDGDFTIKGSGKAYRFRRSGAALDLEFGGASLVVSGWTGAAFTGTQSNAMTIGVDGKITAEHITSPANTFAQVTTSQTTTSTTYADLATTGPTCSVTLPSSQNVLVIIRSRLGNNTTAGAVSMSFATSGATTLAAADQQSINHNGSGNAEQYCNFWVVPCNSGTTTFTSKYKVVSGTGAYTDRQMVVIPL